MQDVTDVGTRRLTELLGSFDLVQHVNGPTQRHGNTLDLVITPSHFVPAGVTLNRRVCYPTMRLSSLGFHWQSSRPLLRRDWCVAGVMSTGLNSVGFWKTVSCHGRRQMTSTSTSCLRRIIQCCRVSLTALLHSTASVDAAAICRRGLMLSVGSHGVSVVDFSADIDERMAPPTVKRGSTRHAGLTCTAGRGRSTGVSD